MSIRGRAWVGLGAAVVAMGAAAWVWRPARAAGGGERPGSLLVDESAWWRYCLYGGPARICPEMMAKDGKRLLKDKGLQRLEERVLRKLKEQGRTTDDWRKELYYEAYSNLDLLNVPGVATTPPPAGWMKLDFDDADWSRQRKPFKMAKDFYVDGIVDHFYQVRSAYFRAAFEVGEPEKTGELRLRLIYRGGVRAFLNGREIGRGHLPAGELRPDVPAEPYPAEAYHLLDGEYPADRQPSGHRLEVLVKPEVPLVPDLAIYQDAPEDFDQLDKSDKVPGPYRRPRAIGYPGDCFLNRAGWERIMKLRNRVLEVAVPRELTRRGGNVLAVELRSSELGPAALGWSIPWSGNLAWKHGWLLGVELRARGEGLPSAMARPGGVQAWAEDIHHRLYSPDFHPAAAPRGARIVAARNGTFAAQLAIATDRELKGLRASISDFRGDGAARLGASIARILYPVGHPAWDLRALGQRKGSGDDGMPGFAEGAGNAIVERYATAEELSREGGAEATMKRVRFYDHLSPAPPAAVAAGSCQPVRVSVAVPADAAPGSYRAAVRLEAEGLAPIELPLELEVVDWRVPDPADFRTIVAFEQSPYGVARHYKVEPWSEDHFRRLNASFELLGKVGNDLLIVPVLCHTEFGNLEDSPVRFVRGKDGEVRLDPAALDRYLDLALRHWGPVRCVAFVVDHAESQAVKVRLHDEAAGRAELVDIGPDAPADVRRGLWRAIAAGILRHMASRGLERSVHWGVHGDIANDPSLIRLLREFAPDIRWVRLSHYNGPDETYALCGSIRRAGQELSPTSRKGWNAPADRINLWVPRNWNGAAVCYGTSEPFAYRLGVERALVSGLAGVARFGADYWDSTWLHGFPRCPYAGLPVVSTFWPGPQGAESSIRFEVFREGLQEAEARIFLEQAAGKLNDPQFARQVADLLNRRIYDTLYALVSAPHCKIEEYSTGWQGRSRRLYQAAAEAARRLGVDFARDAMNLRVPARGKVRLPVGLRNWAAPDRPWRLDANQPWLLPRPAGGSTAPARQGIELTVDASGLRPGQVAKGTLTLTDVRTGRTEGLAVTARISDVLGFDGPETVANVACGGKGVLSFTLRNSSAAELDWAIAATQPWVRPDPADGKLPAGGQCPVAVTIAPPDRMRARHEVTLRIEEKGGAALAQPLVVHVLPDRREPAARPGGQAVPMEDLPADRLISHLSEGRKRNPKEALPFHQPGKRYGYWGLAIGRTRGADGKDKPVREFERGLALPPASEVTYRIEGQGFRAFAAEVGCLSEQRLGGADAKLHFEVYLDGRHAGHSGLMSPRDEPRLIVVQGLEGAREIRLVTRLHDDRLNDQEMRLHGVWGDPAFYR